MKLVMTYTIGDDCTWWANEIRPFEYESVEAALVDFEYAVDKAIVEHENFVFAGHHFDRTNFTFWDVNKKRHGITLPSIQTLEEWFENNKGKNVLRRNFID